MWGESKWSAALLQYILIALNLPHKKSKLYKTLYYWRRDMLNFIFLEKGLGLVSSPHFVSDFSIKMFLMLHSINWPDFIVWFPLLLEILGNMYIAIACFPDCDVINLDIKFTLIRIILIKPFFYMAKKSREKCKYLERKISF